jgi:TRAP transporter TAXI family solute receptor
MKEEDSMTARFVAASIAAALIATAPGASAQQVSLGTSGAGSIYHQTGSVIAKILNEKGGVQTTIQPFASPNVFIPSINAGEMQLGMANIAEVSYAFEGTDHFQGRPHKELRVVAIAFPLRSTIFVRKDSPIKSLADLKGRPAVDGFTSQRIILPLLDAMYATVGLTRKDMRPVQVPNVVIGADLFAAGKADMFFFAIGAPKPREVDAAVGGIRMLSLPNTPGALAALKKHYPHGYLRLENPNPGSVGVLEPGYSLAYDALVFAGSKTPDNVAYQAAKVMHENAKEMGESAPPLRLFNPKQMAKEPSPVPYHPGAIKFYREAGIWPGK